MDTELITRRSQEIPNAMTRAEAARRERDAGRQIFQRLCARLAELDLHPESRFPHSKAIADVVVTTLGQETYFEPQNWETMEWLCRRFGITIRNAQARDKIRVPSSERHSTIAELRAAGFEVLC